MVFGFWRRRNDQPLQIPLTQPVANALGVYLSVRGEPPTAESLRGKIQAAFESLDPPLGAVLVDWSARGLLNVVIVPREQAPEPPESLLQMGSPGDAVWTRYKNATHLVLVSAHDLIGPMSLGLWSVTAAAAALAEEFGGVVIDPEFPRLLSEAEVERPIPPDGRITIMRHTRILHSLDRRGLVWMTTKGLCHFGLPELEMTDVPPNLNGPFATFLNGVSWVLLKSAWKALGVQGADRSIWSVGPELRLDLADIAEATGADPREPEPGVRGWTTFRLEWRPARKRQAAFLRIVPPRHFQGGQGVWLNAALVDILGAEREIVGIEADDAAMAEAHRRAVAALPTAKSRFQAGLPMGSEFYIKHGFPRTNEPGLHEFMWVVVKTWKGDKIQGILANDPQYRLDLRAGQDVSLRDDDVFDWMLVLPNGQREGGYTTEVATERRDPSDEEDPDDDE